MKALCGGPFIISDHMASVSSKRMRIAKQLLPPTGLAAIPIDLLDKEIPEILRLEMSAPGLVGAASSSWTLLGEPAAPFVHTLFHPPAAC